MILAPPLWATGSWVDDSWADGTWATSVVIHQFKARTVFFSPAQVRVLKVPKQPTIDEPESVRIMVQE